MTLKIAVLAPIPRPSVRIGEQREAAVLEERAQAEAEVVQQFVEH